MISDAQLDNLVARLMSDHGILVRHSLMFRHLQLLGLRVQRDRIRESNCRVERGNSRQNLMRANISYSSLIWMCALTLTSAVFQSRSHSCRRSRAAEKRSCQCNTCVSGLYSSIPLDLPSFAILRSEISGSWDLLMRKGSAQRLHHAEVIVSVNRVGVNEYKPLNVNKYIP